MTRTRKKARTADDGFDGGRLAVHVAHCCRRHGCRYGMPGCPVAAGRVRQTRPCEDCHCYDGVDDMETFDAIVAGRIPTCPHCDRPLTEEDMPGVCNITAVQTVALIKAVYDAAYDATESFEVAAIGIDLAYLLGAIAKGEQAEWSPRRAIVRILREAFPDASHPVWTHLVVAEGGDA